MMKKSVLFSLLLCTPLHPATIYFVNNTGIDSNNLGLFGFGQAIERGLPAQKIWDENVVKQFEVSIFDKEVVHNPGECKEVEYGGNVPHCVEYYTTQVKEVLWKGSSGLVPLIDGATYTLSIPDPAEPFLVISSPALKTIAGQEKVETSSFIEAK